MKKLIKKLLRENLLYEDTTKEDFFNKHNIDADELSYLGKGDFGTAYSIGDGRVLKITSSKNEFEIAKSLVGKYNVPALDGIVDFYVAETVDGEGMIIMEELDEDSSIEDLFYELHNYLDEQGLPIQYLDNLDIDELDLSDEMHDFINDLDDIIRGYRYIGIEASDIKPDNMGRDKNGKLKAFDIDDRDRR